MKLHEISLQNLQVLLDHDNTTHFLNVKDKIVLESKECDKDYENITELSDLEYAIHFTFHHTFTLLDNNIYNRKKIINQMILALHTIYDIYQTSLNDDSNKRIVSILDHIEDVLYIIYDNYFYYYYYYKVQTYFSYLLEGFKKTKIIISDKLQEQLNHD